MSKPNVVLKITSSIAIAGQVVTPGQLVEVTNSEAKNLLALGKAVVATEEDGVFESASGEGSDPALNPEIEAFNADAVQRADEDAAAALAEADALAAQEAADAEALTAQKAAEDAAAAEAAANKQNDKSNSGKNSNKK